MKKRPLWRIFTVFEFSENMRTGQDQSLQHFDRGWLIGWLVDGDLPIAELPDSIHFQPENPYEVQDDSGICTRHYVEQIFPDISTNFHAPGQQWINESQKGQYQYQKSEKITARLIRLMLKLRKNYCMGMQHSIQC